jgi:hypothetical protein
MWKNYGTARQATDGNIIRRMRFECRITKATDTHSEYAILTAFPRQQWLRERAPQCYVTRKLPVVFPPTYVYDSEHQTVTEVLMPSAEIYSAILKTLFRRPCCDSGG